MVYIIHIIYLTNRSNYFLTEVGYSSIYCEFIIYGQHLLLFLIKFIMIILLTFF